MNERQKRLHDFVDKCMVGIEKVLDEDAAAASRRRLHEQAHEIGQPTWLEELAGEEQQPDYEDD